MTHWKPKMQLHETNSPTPVSANQKRLNKFKRAGTWYEIKEMLTKDDLYKLEPLFRKAHEEFQSHLDFDFDAILRHADYKLADPERMTYNGWAAYREGVPVGFFIGSLASMFISTDKVAASNVWFVDKPYRGSPVAFLLLKQFLLWGSIRGAVRFVVNVIFEKSHSRKQIELFHKMANKLGFKEAGVYFVRDVNAASMDDR